MSLTAKGSGTESLIRKEELCLLVCTWGGGKLEEEGEVVQWGVEEDRHMARDGDS